MTENAVGHADRHPSNFFASLELPMKPPSAWPGFIGRRSARSHKPRAQTGWD